MEMVLSNKIYVDYNPSIFSPPQKKKIKGQDYIMGKGENMLIIIVC